MKVYLKKFVWGELTLILTLACFGFLPTALAVTPAREGGYRNQNTAQDEDGLFSLMPGVDNTTNGFDALDSNTTGSDNALASWTWTLTGRLNTARYVDTATLLQNGMVLVAGGFRGNFQNVIATPSAELYESARRTWTRTGSLATARAAHTATLLQNGMVLVAGGYSDVAYFASAELYDPASGAWIDARSLTTA